MDVRLEPFIIVMVGVLIAGLGFALLDTIGRRRSERDELRRKLMGK